ncbi:hypothetical protein GCM10023115_17400 [Pontixanthobacter gangjinensis]|uniref:SPOR domain-containing protein n=1 Tax=Pontixanthobacter gangjinensis TaxID=1028742 RepID=A0A6I4SMS5_9SPHN|nr:SPOR domain-containing protein [Pontixanthobacter gangjinensis]MXO56984.1 hypothetical protein [Pontixanthobacter gangjinensis]
MRLPNRVSTRFPAYFWALGLTALLAACGRGGNDPSALVSATDGPSSVQSGPAADYPVIVGDPYYIGQTLYTPFDTMNYDEVGYAMADPEGGSGVTVSHRTLPMPSYVEITALDSGKTILARVERRGPMTGNGVVGLSNAAQRQLEVSNRAPIRIRRVNSAEVDRAKLRGGEAAPARMDTPKSLLAVLKRKLPEAGAASLAVAQQATPETAPAPAPALAKAPATAMAAARELPAVPKAMAAATPGSTPFENAFSTTGRKAVTAYPLAPITGSKPPIAAQAATPLAKIATNDAPKPVSPASTAPTQSQVTANFVIQAAAFSSKDNADRVADSIDGFVQKSGRFYRVRKGPFANRGQAEAALAKVRAAGYSDARVFTAG